MILPVKLIRDENVRKAGPGWKKSVKLVRDENVRKAGPGWKKSRQLMRDGFPVTVYCMVQITAGFPANMEKPAENLCGIF